MPDFQTDRALEAILSKDEKETPSGKPLGVCRVLPVLGEAKDFRRSQLRKSRTVHDAIVDFF